MFKSKKTQFAIRKMAKGTAAFLLSFCILGSNLGGLVSAATEIPATQHAKQSDSEEADIKIAYLDENGHYQGSAPVITLKKGETKTKAEIKAAIYAAIPKGYDLIDQNLGNIEDITFSGNQNSFDISVQIKKKTSDIKISYVDGSGKTLHSLPALEFKYGETITREEIIAKVKDGLPSGYNLASGALDHISDISYDENKNSFDISIKVDPIKEIVTTPDDVKDPESEKLVKHVTRKIIIDFPEGKNVIEYQKVTYQRNRIQIGDKIKYTDWQLAKNSKDSWEEFKIEQIKNYDSYIDGKLGYLINSQKVTEKTEDQAVYVTYKKKEAQKGDIKIKFLDDQGKQIGKWVTTPFDIKNGKNRDEIIAFIKENLPTGYQFEDESLPEITDIEADGEKNSYDFTVKVKPIHHTTTEYRTIKRVINITGIDGQKDSITQSVTFTRDKISFENGDAPIYTNWTAKNGISNWAQMTLPTIDNFKILIDNQEGSLISGQTVSPDDQDQEINVTYEPIEKIVTPNDVDNPDAEGLLKRVTRTIVLNLPNGEKKEKNQTVTYQRNKVVLGNKVSYTHWELAKGSDKQWLEYKLPQIDGYASYINGQSTTTVEAEDANWDTNDKTIYVSYIKQAAQLADIKIAYVNENGQLIHALDKIDIEVGKTYSAKDLKEIVNKNLPANYELVDKNLENITDIKATLAGQSFDLNIQIKGQTINPDQDYSDAQADQFKRMYRHISINRPDGSTRTELQTITYSRSKVYKGNSSTKTRATNADQNSWEYGDWQIHGGSGQTGTWESHAIKQFDGYQAVINYPKFLDDEEERNIEDYTVEERSITLDPRESNADDVTRNVTVTYRPLAQDPDTPNNPDNPSDPDTPDTPDKPTEPDTPNTPENPGSPETPNEPSQPEDENTSNDKDDSANDENANKPSENLPITDSVLKDDISTDTVHPLASIGSSNPEDSNQYLPETGADNSMKASTAGIISIAIASLIGGVGAWLGKRNRKKDE